MGEKIITATLHNMSPVPNNSVYRGDGVFEFTTQRDLYNVKEKLAELDIDKGIYFKNSKLKTKLSSDSLATKLKIKKQTKV